MPKTLIGRYLMPLILLSFGSGISLAGELRKCCAPGEIFSGKEKVICVPTPFRSMEMYVVNPEWTRDVTGQRNESGLPDCEDPEDVETTALEELLPAAFLPSPACLDILHEETAVQSMPIVVHCRSNKDRQKEDETPLPTFTNVRRCCPRSTVFDRNLKTCVPVDVVDDAEQPPSTENLFLSLLPGNVGLLDFLLISRGPPRCKHAIFDYIVSPADLHLRDHTLRVSISSNKTGLQAEELSISGYEACLELTTASEDGHELILRTCQGPDFCDENPCVRKCCSEDESFGKGCQKFSGPTERVGFHETLKNVTSEANSSIADYGLLVGSPCAYGMYPVHRNEGWSITTKGHVYVPHYEIYKHDMYCMDILGVKDGVVEETIYPLICFEKPDGMDEPSSLRFEVNSALLLTSCAFMLVTLLVYICLPVLQNLHGKTLMCHVASLLVAYSCLAIIGLATPTTDVQPDQETRSTIICKFLGYLLLFSFSSAFSWLNIMCFDIWWTFGGLRGSTSRSRGHRKRFLSYCLYAWGLALLISIFAISADYTEILPANMRPDIGQERCWFAQGSEIYGEVLFFTGPISIQLLTNVVFFVLTSVHCSKVKAEIRRVIDDRSDPRSRRFHADRTKLIMNVKLFIVMGISWILEMVSYFLNHYAKDLQWRVEFFYVSDALNCLQGLLIFILFVLKSRVYLALRKRLGLDKDQRKASNTTTALDPYRVKKSASSSTLMSTFAVSVAP